MCRLQYRSGSEVKHDETDEPETLHVCLLTENKLKNTDFLDVSVDKNKEKLNLPLLFVGLRV